MHLEVHAVGAVLVEHLAGGLGEGEVGGVAAGELRPQREGAAQLVDGDDGVLAQETCPIGQEGAGAVAAGDAEVLLEVAEALLGLRGGGGEADPELEGGEVLGPDLEDRVDLGEGGRGVAERELEVGDLEAEAELLFGVGGEVEAAAEEVDEAAGVVAVAEDPLEQGHARLVVLDGLEGLGKAGLGVGAVAELERQLADPALYEDRDAVEDLTTRHGAAKDKAVALMAEWEALSLRVDAAG